MGKTRRSARQDVAVVSIGAIFPGRGDTTGFWRDIVEGVDTFRDVPETHWLPEDYHDSDPATPDKTYGKRGGFLSPQAFDPVAFGVPPNALASTDTSQLLALIAAQQVLETALRESDGKIDTSRTSVILGVASATELTAHMAGRLHRPAWVKAMREAGLAEGEVQDIADRIASNFTEWRESTFPGLLGNVIAGRIANRLDLGGSNYVTDAACASSLSALQIAMHELQSGDSDTVLTGGVDTLNDILMFMCFSKTPALSPTGDCRPFSAHADGTMLGEGIGMIALRRLEDAERDGNRIHAVIKGLGGGSDGRATAIYAPLSSGQARALGRAYDQAGYDPKTVALVEAHGTGTIAGDKAELEGLHRVFGHNKEGQDPWCAIGSVKSQIGHTKAAAGSASLIKIIGALSRKVLPPTLKVEEPAPALSEKTPFYLNTHARPWIAKIGSPRRASVSSFGFGGSNFHATLEEYTGPNAAHPPRVLPAELFLFSADSKPALQRGIKDVSENLLHEDDLSRLASQTHGTFQTKAKHRSAIIAGTLEEFRTKAGKLDRQLSSHTAGPAPLGIGLHYAQGNVSTGKVAFLFAGQGSQYVGMGASLAMAFPEARRIWDRAATESRHGDTPPHMAAFPPVPFTEGERQAQADRLTAMENAQPTIAAVSLAQLKLFERLGLAPEMCAGHSFGEVMALHTAGAFDADAALQIARSRGRIMSEAAASSEGGMLAVQAGADAVRDIVDEVGCGLVIANDNAPDQIVLSGALEAIKLAEKRCQAAGLKAHRLNVATGFHSSCVSEAVTPFSAALKDSKFTSTTVPVFANTSAAPYPKTPANIRDRLAKQIGEPVRFRESLEAMYDAGARVFIEIGPGSVVSTLARNTLASKDVHILSLDNKRGDDVVHFLSALGELSVLGHDLDLAALYAELPPCPEQPERPKFAVEINGANYQKPYPPPGGASALPPPNPVSNNTPPEIEPRTQNMPDKQPPHAIQAPTMHPETENERIHRDISARHYEFMQMMTAAHTTFLNSLPGAQRQTPQLPPHPAPQTHMPAQTLPTAPANGHADSMANGHATSVAQPVQTATFPAPPAQTVNNAPTPVPPAPPPAAIPAQPNPLALVTKLVADKTGYPADMLDPDMDLEGELGVDSIKQVEILSTLRETVPGLPEVEPEKLIELRTIRLVANFISGEDVSSAPQATSPAIPHVHTPAPVAAPSPQPQPTDNGSTARKAGVNSDIIRELIAEKTGYPPDMLEDDMDLEGELGIDSIKQVEILSTLRDRIPDLPEIESEQLAEMRTIRKIADFFQ